MTLIKSIFAVIVFAFVAGCTPTYNIEKAKQGIVAIGTEYTDGTFGPDGPQTKVGLGTGFFIKENYIVTAYHVVGKASKIVVQMENGSSGFEAEFVYGDEFLDAAVIRIKDWQSFKKAHKVKYLKLAPRNEIYTMKEVYSVGHPWGLSYTVSKGIISNEMRRLEPNPKWFIQTDARVFQGNSGGPLLDGNGAVVGLNVMMIAKEGGSFGVALPTQLFMKAFADFEKYGEIRWPSLGVLLSNDAIVQETLKDSAAEKAGFTKGDKILGIIYGDDYIDVKDSDYLIATFSTFDYNKRAEIIYERNGVEYTLEIYPGYKLSSDFKTELGKR